MYQEHNHDHGQTEEDNSDESVQENKTTTTEEEENDRDTWLMIQIDEILKKFDLDNNGFITYHEFQKAQKLSVKDFKN
jgi:Ca2+-binding EF-hand superfamily protein